MIAARIVAALAGVVVASAAFGSAVRAVVVPRGDRNAVTEAVFRIVLRVYRTRMRRRRDVLAREALLARYPAMSMMMLPFAWVAMVIVGFALMYWSLGVPGPRDALQLSGSSVTTLGFFGAPDGPTMALAIIEATIGLGIVALLISFLPTIYSVFSQREEMVSLMRTRAGSPALPWVWLTRAQRIGWAEDQLDVQWLEWERWFIQIEESHVSYPALPFFRSPIPESSWVTTAGAVLDTAALRIAVVDLPRSAEAHLCIRSGFLALRRIADHFGLTYDPDPAPDDPISIERWEFDEAVERLRVGGVPVVEDLDAAWRAFAGWRVNYDVPLRKLCGLVKPPPAPWSQDRAIPVTLRAFSLRRRR